MGIFKEAAIPIPGPDRTAVAAPPPPPPVAPPKPRVFDRAVPRPTSGEAGGSPVTAGPAAAPSATPTEAPPAATKDPSPLDRFVGAAKSIAGSIGGHVASGVTGAVDGVGADLVDGLDTVTKQIQAATDPAPAIDKLNGTGDTATFSGTALASIRVANPLTDVPAGPQVSYGYDATVTQTQPQPCGPPGYDVQFGKNEAGGLGTVFGVGGAQGDKVVVSGEVNLATADRVTTSFTSKADATRAVRISSRAALAQSIRDMGGALQGGIPNPRNPLTGTGKPDSLLGRTLAGVQGLVPGPLSVLGTIARPALNAVADMVQPSAADTQFMRDHITSYSTVLSGTARGAVEVALLKLSGGKLPTLPGANKPPAAPVPGGANPKLKGELTAQPRLLEAARITRTVSLPPGGGPGTLSYSVGTDISADMKERATAIGKFAGASQLLPIANVADLGKASLQATVSYDMTQAETDTMRQTGGNSLPEVAMAQDGRLGRPTSATATLETAVPVQNPLLPYRTDQNQLTAKATLADPAGFAGDLVDNVLHGRLGDSVDQAKQQGRIQVTDQTLDRSGHSIAIDPSVGVLNEFSVGAGALLTVGNDHVTNTMTYDSHPDTPANCAPPRPVQPPQPTEPPHPVQPPRIQPQPRQLVVLPREGVNVRAQPSVASDKVAVVQSGSFLQADGKTATDAAGRRWASVSGTDVHDRPTRGWVDAEFLQRHDAGAMNATGRVDPRLAAQGYDHVVGRVGDTVWDLATANGKDPSEAVKLNRDHIIDPNLIFEGDTIYMPK